MWIGSRAAIIAEEDHKTPGRSNTRGLLLKECCSGAHDAALTVPTTVLNALTDIPRLLSGGQMISGAAAACYKTSTGR